MDRLSLIEMLFAAFPNAAASKANHLAYLEVLAEVPLDELRTVIRQCMREGGNFPPSAGQVLQKWQALNAPAIDAAEQGWLSVQKAMHDPAAYSPDPEGPAPKFSDPIVRRVVAALGWHALRMSEQPRVDQAQFIKLYNAFAERQQSEHRMSQEYKQLQDSHQENSNGNGIVTKRLPG